MPNLEVAGSSPAPGSTPQPTVVVLGARSEQKLKRLAYNLAKADVPHVVIAEPDPPYDGQVMAVGLMPGDKAALADHVKEFHMLRFEQEMPT